MFSPEDGNRTGFRNVVCRFITICVFWFWFCVCVCVRSGLFCGLYFGLLFWGFQFFVYNVLLVLGHQTMNKVQKHTSINANTPSSETYRNESINRLQKRYPFRISAILSVILIIDLRMRDLKFSRR
jgi:hypothetical protein